MRIITSPEEIASALDLGDASKLISPDANAVEAIVFPETIDELCGVLKKYHTNLIRVAGARTGLTGGCVPQLGTDGAKEVLIRLENLLAVPDIHGYETRVAENIGIGKRTITYATDGTVFVLPAGATLDERTEILRRYKRFFPIHPTSQDASVGGTVTTNATGLEGAFGSTRNWTKVLGVYLADGRFAHLSDCRGSTPKPKMVQLDLQDGTSLDLTPPTYPWNSHVKNASGIFTGEGRYPLDLFIGHDGALGICAYAGFRTLPKRVKAGEDIWAGMIFFDHHQKALDFVLEAASPEYALQNGTTRIDLIGENLGIVGVDWIGGAGMEVGKQYLQRTRQSRTVPLNAVVGLEIGLLMNDQETAEKVARLIEKHHALETQWFSPEKVQDIRRFRHSIPAGTNDLVYKKVGTDCAVPLDKMSEMHEYWLEQLREYAVYCNSVGFRGLNGQYGVEIGHPFRGHMHYNLLNNNLTYEEARKVQGRIIQKAIELGGVPSGEHGIGAKTAFVLVNNKHDDFPLIELLHGRKALDEIYHLKVALGAEKLNRGVLIPINHR